MMCVDEEEREVGRHRRAIVGRTGGPPVLGSAGRRSAGRASSATQSPSAIAVSDVQTGRLERRARPRPRGRRRSPRRAACRRGRSSAAERRRRAARAAPAMRLARTTSNGRLAARQAALAGRDATRRRRSGARSRSSPRSRSGRCRRRAPTAAPEPHRRDRQDPGPAADVEDARGRRRTPAVGEPLERGEAQPGRRVEPGPERHPRVEREDDVVGLAAVPPPGRPDHEPPADAQHREVRLPGLGPVGLVDDARRQLADRPQAERLEVAERLGSPRPTAGSTAAAVARRQVGPDDRRPGRVDAARRGPRRPARTPARRSSRRAPPGRGSR